MGKMASETGELRGELKLALRGRPTVRLVFDGQPRASNIYVGDLEISSICRGFTLDWHVGDLGRLSLGLVAALAAFYERAERGRVPQRRRYGRVVGGVVGSHQHQRGKRNAQRRFRP